MLAILGRCIKSKQFSTGRRWMWICRSGLQINNFGTFSSWVLTGCGGWPFEHRLCRLRSRLSGSVACRCTCSFVSPACVGILCGAILARGASSQVVFMKHSRESFYRSLHLIMPRKLNTPLLLISDLGVRFLDQIVHFLYCCAQKLFIGHSGHIQGQAHVGLFQLYLTSLPCHSSRHGENLQEIRCYL